MAETGKNLPAMQETQVQSLVGENPLERGIKQPPPVFLPGESHGQSSLSGYNPWSRKELDTTEQSTKQSTAQYKIQAKLVKVILYNFNL